MRLRNNRLTSIINIYSVAEKEEILEVLTPYFKDKREAYRGYQSFIHRITIPSTYQDSFAQDTLLRMVKLNLLVPLTPEDTKIATLALEKQVKGSMGYYLLTVTLAYGLHKFFSNLDLPYSLKPINEIKKTFKELTKNMNKETRNELIWDIVRLDDGFRAAMALLDEVEEYK